MMVLVVTVKEMNVSRHISGNSFGRSVGMEDDSYGRSLGCSVVFLGAVLEWKMTVMIAADPHITSNLKLRFLFTFKFHQRVALLSHKNLWDVQGLRLWRPFLQLHIHGHPPKCGS